jgi:hypothetical protein
VKYVNLNTGIYPLFETDLWKAEKIKTYPTNFIGLGKTEEFIRVSIIPSGNGVNRNSISGVLIIDIFTPAGGGPTRPSEIADKLDSYLTNKQFTVSVTENVQLGASTLGNFGNDKDNKALYKATYTVPFNYFEVL